MDMGSMGMGSTGGIFTPENKAIALGFWYGVAGCVGVLTLARAVSALQSRRRLKLYQSEPHSVPSRPRGRISQAYATATATVRELLYPQPTYFTGRISRFFTPLPLGRWLLLAFYWTVILCFLWSNTILGPNDSMYAYKWEKVGFRAAWVSVTQIPFIYLLSCKFNPISLLTGISYERFNWVHRWAARTVFLTIVVHWTFFFTEWYIGGYVDMELKTMTMVKYGFGAWGVITWMILSGFGFFRALNYELFVVQHIAAAGVLLWLLFLHVPAYAQYNIWMSVGFLAFDWGARIIWGVLQNTHLMGGIKSAVPGYSTRLEALPGNVVRLTLQDVDFKWRAGQHVYISIPRLRPFEIHPFTIANAPTLTGDHQQTRQLQLLIQAQAGFSRSLLKAATRDLAHSNKYRAFLSGPWGHPPNLLHYETVVMVACGSGASFIVPMLQDLEQRRGCVQKVDLHWIVRTRDHVSWFERELHTLLQSANRSNLRLQVHIHVTKAASQPTDFDVAPEVKTTDLIATTVSLNSSSPSDEEQSSGSMSSSDSEQSPLSPVMEASHKPSSLIMTYQDRPRAEDIIRPAVEQARGETAVVVCGGVAITAQCRTFVAAFSDERAVHKGTGAQGIFLFTETYGW